MDQHTPLLSNLKILSQRELSSIIPYSPVHIARLERAGKFPKRIKLGPNRVGWSYPEVIAWLDSAKDARFDQTEPDTSDV